MPADNLDIWKKVIFRIPETKKLIGAIFLLGVLYSLGMYGSLKAFTSIEFSPWIIPLLAAFIFILPAIASAELLHRFIDEYPRKWGYFLAFCNQAVLFIYSLILTGADNFLNAWNILWLGIITVYLSNFLVLMLTIGYDYTKRISLLSLTQPLIILISFHVFLGGSLQIPALAYLSNLSVLLFAAFILIATFLIAEFLIRANVRNVSVLGLTSGLLQKKQEALDLGYPTRPDVQTLLIENSSGSAELAVPWIHPGPLEGFGGGEITSNIIEDLNTGDGEGFFLHVPSTHKSDPANPEDYRKILDAMEKPETHAKASKLLKRQYGEISFYGRKVNGKKLVFLDPSDSEELDDYEMSIFLDSIDLDETLLVDLHNHERKLQGFRKEVWYNTETAELLKGYLFDFLEEIEEQPVYDYRAGFSADPEDTKIFSLVEEVGGQETLLCGIEGNEAGEELRELEKEYSHRFDEVMVFTTDTHRSIHELSREKQVEPDRVRRTVEKSYDTVSNANIGFASGKADKMNLLQEDYSGLIFSINILVRLLPLALLILYLGLVLWVF